MTFLMVLSLGLSQWGIASDLSSPGFLCKNAMYRAAIFEISPSELTIQDSGVEGSENLEKLLKGPTPGVDLHIHKFNLRVPLADLNCDFSPPHHVQCRKSAPSLGAAQLSVEGSELIHGKYRKYIRKTQGVKLSEFELVAAPYSPWPREIQVESSAVLEIDGQLVRIKWTPFFYLRDDSHLGSSCIRI